MNELDEEGRRIQSVLAGVDRKDIMSTLETWKKHLEKILKFPFEAVVFEEQEEGPLEGGDKLLVKRIFDVDDLYGIDVEVWLGRKKYYFPLCDLEVTKKRNPNYLPVKDYCVWFANKY